MNGNEFLARPELHIKNRKRKRVTRTLVTEGDAEWVDTVIARSRVRTVGEKFDMLPVGVITCTTVLVEEID